MVFWTKGRTALLVALHSTGLSAALVAARIPGSTKNSVIGRLSRLKVPAPTVPKISLKVERKIIAAEVVVPLTLMQLKKHSCRWPLWGDDAPETARFFCSAYASGDGKLYCKTHTEKARSKALHAPRARPYIPARA